MEKYTYIRKTVTWQNRAGGLRQTGRTHHQPQKHPLRRRLNHRGPVVRPVAGHLQGSLRPNNST